MGQVSLQDAIKQLLNGNPRLKQGLHAAKIKTIWEEIMGKTVAKYTTNIQLVNGTLFVHTDMAPLRNELLYQKDKIIQRINEAFGEKVVEKVVIK